MNEIEFENIRNSAIHRWEAFQNSDKIRIRIGTATCGRSAGAIHVKQAFQDELFKHGILSQIIEVGCVGLCFAEPIVSIQKPGHPEIFYGNVTPEITAKLVEEFLIKDNPLAQFSLGSIGDKTEKDIEKLLQTSILKPQIRRVLKKCGSIDPTNFDHYLANDGYLGFMKALKMNPKDVIEEIKKSGLRGRGGGGFPTGRKWQFCHDAKGSEKYLICNADEGDPGAFMNRSLLEGDPHAVLEGMLIAGYAIGASRGFIYCRAEYPLALERIAGSIKQMNEIGLLGENIFGSKFSFHIKVKEGAGAFVCGEETALIASIEGKRGMPRPRPPFPAISGLWAKPTIINNVETLASVALILQNGSDWFSQFGTEKSKGTKTFALVGKVKRPGLVEVPLGIKLREIIYDIGDGILGNRTFKAVQTGGPSGGCIPPEHLSLPVDYESLASVGAIIGSGGMVVMDEDTCMVDLARYFLDFIQKESCGKCVPCRLGTKQMLEILQEITMGRGKPGDIELLTELAESVKISSLCGLGQTAPNPVLSTVRYFKHEYEAHIHEKRCSALVCKALLTYRILPEKCIGCHLCFKVCPAGAIDGESKKPHVIDEAKCIKCSACFDVCPPKIKAVQCVSEPKEL